MSKAPAFQFYARDWLADSKVRRLRLDERGALFESICERVAAGDRSVQDDYGFIGRVFVGQSRPGLSSARRRDVLSAGQCAECGTTENLEVDHILPWSRGGTHNRDNLQALCFSCNRDKSNRTEAEWKSCE